MRFGAQRLRALAQLPAGGAPLAFAGYRAAVDREEKAAIAHAEPCGRLGETARATP